MEFDPRDVKSFISEQQLGQSDEFGESFRGRIPDNNAYSIDPQEVLIKASRNRTSTATPGLDTQFRNSLKLRGLKHKNIIRLIGYAETPEHYYLVFELPRGKPLADIISSSSGLSWEATLNGLIELASGIAYLHKNRLVHSNISSGSVLVAEGEGNVYVPKVIDFRFCTEEGGSRSGGAPGYYHGLGGDDDVAVASKDCDTFAFGVVALQIVTMDGRIGFVDRGIGGGSAQCRHIVQRYLPLFKESGNLVDPAYGDVGYEGVKVSEVIIKCLAKDDKPTMEDVVKDLRLIRVRRKLVGSSFSPHKR